MLHDTRPWLLSGILYLAALGKSAITCAGNQATLRAALTALVISSAKAASFAS